MTDRSQSHATFYQYKLLSKIMIPRPLLGLYLCFPCAAVAAEMLLLDWTSSLFFLLSFFLVLWIQHVIGRSVLFIISPSYLKRWRAVFHTPWIGYMPEQYISRLLFKRIQGHILWIGLCLFAAMAPWSPPAFLYSLLFWHLWLLAPRFYALFHVRKLPKEGMFRFYSREISYYQQ